MWLFTLVGSKVKVIAATVLAAGLILFSTIRYIQKAEDAKEKLEEHVEEQEVLENVQDAIVDSPTNRDDALEWLSKRQRK